MLCPYKPSVRRLLYTVQKSFYLQHAIRRLLQYSIETTFTSQRNYSTLCQSASTIPRPCRLIISHSELVGLGSCSVKFTVKLNFPKVLTNFR